VGLAGKEDGEDETEPEKVELEAAPDAMIGCE